ncbi:MAG TPA: class I SAM-dependent methyltransferase [Gemmataceae bacterium]
MLFKTREEAYAAYRDSPGAYFERYHERYSSERELISPDWKWYETRYHYNLVENGIVDLLLRTGHPVTGSAALDVGSGTGHWVDFLLHYLEAEEVVAIDFSALAAQRLRERYRQAPNVTVLQADVSEHRPDFEGRFGLITAVGVMFHIIDDGKWRAAVGNLCRYLRPGGVAIVGGDFGEKTEELGVMRKVRSLRTWEGALREGGAVVCGLKRFNWFKGGVNPGLKDNLLAFRRV